MVLATSVNVARRLSARNDENLQFDDDKSSAQRAELERCQKMAMDLEDARKLPVYCRSYPSVMDTIVKNRSKNDKNMDIAFDGMWAGSAIQARSSRMAGYESDAKLKRRLTTPGHGGSQSWR